MIIPDLEDIRRKVAELGLTDAQIQQRCEAHGKRIGLRAIWAFRKGENKPSWRTIEALSAVLADKSDRPAA